jgi:hypothetical protein
MIMPGFPQVQKECCTYKVMHQQGPKLEFNCSLSHLSMPCSKTVKSTERSTESVQGTRALNLGAHTHAHAHGFWVGMGAIILFMGGHGCILHPTSNRSQTSWMQGIR